MRGARGLRVLFRVEEEDDWDGEERCGWEAPLYVQVPARFVYFYNEEVYPYQYQYKYYHITLTLLLLLYRIAPAVAEELFMFHALAFPILPSKLKSMGFPGKEWMGFILGGNECVHLPSQSKENMTMTLIVIVTGTLEWKDDVTRPFPVCLRLSMSSSVQFKVLTAHMDIRIRQQKIFFIRREGDYNMTHQVLCILNINMEATLMQNESIIWLDGLWFLVATSVRDDGDARREHDHNRKPKGSQAA
ncbi:unnamed protein product [Orchesella dallaii]|uniref:Uncharacterized protein n=1 Tax=Orchesella dallaii TaxID=48710 RepID=A0ABP1RY34_9HEXA